MDVRSAVAADADEVVRLAGLMFATMGLESGGVWAEEGARHVATRLGEDLAVYVVDHPDGAGRLVASAAGSIAPRLPGPFNPSGLAGYVQWVCVDPDYRRHGLGRLVMTALLDWYAERRVTTVELHSTTMAEDLYRSLGFAETGGRAMRRRVD